MEPYVGLGMIEASTDRPRLERLVGTTLARLPQMRRKPSGSSPRGRIQLG